MCFASRNVAEIAVRKLDEKRWLKGAFLFHFQAKLDERLARKRRNAEIADPHRLYRSIHAIGITLQLDRLLRIDLAAIGSWTSRSDLLCFFQFGWRWLAH